jgi:hypothetical protein
MKEYGFFLQTLDFHIPRNQVDRPQERPGFLVEESSCNGVLTYIVLRSNGHGDLAVLKARLMNRFEGTP